MRSAVRQSGSITVFIIVAIVLALIAAGVIYGVQRFGMNDQTPPMVVTEEMMEQGEEANDADDATESPAADDTSDEADVPAADESTPDATEPEEAPTDTSDSSTLPQSESSEPTTSPHAGAESNDELPQTGPSETMAALSLALVTISAVAYIRSLRRL